MRSLLSLGFLLLFGALPALGAENVFSLEDALEIGLLKNTQIRLAQAKMQEVLGTITRQKSVFYPKVKVGGVLIPPTFVGGAGVPIYSARMAPSMKAFRLARAAAETNIRLAILDFVYRARLAYVDAQIAEKQAAAEYANFEEFKGLMIRITALTLSGLKGRSDLLASIVDVQRTAVRYEQAKIKADRLRLDLFQLVGISIGHPAYDLPLQSAFPNFPIPRGSLAALQAQALERRVDLKLLRELQLTDEQRVIIAFAAYFPEFSFITYNQIEMAAPDFLNPLIDSADPTRDPASIEDNPFSESKSKNYLQLTWRVFDGFETHGRVVQREAIAEQKRAAADALEKLIPFQVMRAMEGRDGVMRLAADLEAIPSESIMQSAKNRLSAGFLTRLNYSDIVVQQARFDFSKDQVRYQLARANVELQRALGLGVEFEEAPSPRDDKR